MTEKEIKIQLALGTFKIMYLTIEAIENITDIDLMQQLCNIKFPSKDWAKCDSKICIAMGNHRDHLLKENINDK